MATGPSIGNGETHNMPKSGNTEIKKHARKGVNRYRYLASEKKNEPRTITVQNRVQPENLSREQKISQGTSDAAWQHHPNVVVVDTARTNSTTHDDDAVVMVTPIYGPEPGVVTVYGSMHYSTMAPGHRPQPGDAEAPMLVSDSDDTTLEDPDQTDSDEPPLLHSAVLEAQQLLHNFRESATCHDDDVQELRGALEDLANMMDPARAVQQVTVRFPSESRESWEARGAAMLEEHPDYSTAMQFRLTSPYQDDANWHPYGQMYAKMLALLQLEADDLHAVWPMTHGGEARFRRDNKAILSTWARIGHEQSLAMEKAEAEASAHVARRQVRESVPENYA